LFTRGYLPLIHWSSRKQRSQLLNTFRESLVVRNGWRALTRSSPSDDIRGWRIGGGQALHHTIKTSALLPPGASVPRQIAPEDESAR
ncbi:MAG: hypothetical protein M3Z35_14040, partial [Nitrospirota bacterium]|nr:hypothetical protein [Nitrospirota bacterium]